MSCRVTIEDIMSRPFWIRNWSHFTARPVLLLSFCWGDIKKCLPTKNNKNKVSSYVESVAGPKI